MNPRLALAFSVIALVTFPVFAQKSVDIPNPSIDMNGFLKVASKAAKYRETRRLTEEDFMKMSGEPGVVVLDARSKQKFDELHIKGAVNLSFPDITVDSLATMLPDKNTTILIYCNNNFVNTAAFPRKVPEASLNISTYISLYTYGYRNIYELGPLLDVKTTKLQLISTDKVGRTAESR
jgi:hypothetical protein